MKHNLWKNLVLLLLSSSFTHAEKIPVQLKAELVIGVNKKNAVLQPCSHLLQNCSIVISQPAASCLPQSGSITIKNNSVIIAKNIQPSSADSNFNMYVVANNSCPANLYPNNSCVISFNTNSPLSFVINNVLVQGSNTTATYFDMQAIVCGVPATSISANPTDEPFFCTENTSGLPQDITITNNGSVPAINITATIDPSSGITITNNCPASLAPGISCILTYSPGNQIATFESPVSGINTNTATITFNQQLC